MKKLIIAALVLVVLGVALFLGRGPYNRYRQRVYVAQAEEFLAKSDYRNAALSAREALDVSPCNFEACRIFARLAEIYQSPDSVAWRRRVVELRPSVTAYRLELAQTALQFGDFLNADEALRGVQEADRRTAAYHAMAAMVAVGEKNVPLAEAHLAEAAKLDPQDAGVKFDLAVIDMQAKDPAVAAQARATMEQMAADAHYRRDALRHLVLDALQNGKAARADTFSRELEAEKPAMFGDGLLRLGVLKENRSADYAAGLAAREQEAAQNPQEIQALAAWLLDHDQTDEEVRWLPGLPAKTETAEAVEVSLADVYAKRQEWSRLQALLEGHKWPNLEFTRLAMLARAFRGQGQELAAEANWRLAVTAADDRQWPLTVLVRLADNWKWSRETEETAWLLADHFPSERWALELVNRVYNAAGDTRGLQRVAEKFMEYDAADVVARNNFAAVSLLLNMDTARAQQIARENYARYTNNVVLASTYAYSLHVQGRTQEGLKVLETFPAERLELPGVATYYGVLLAASGQPARARKYLDAAARTPLLPEEKVLVAAARNAPLSGK